MNLLYLLLNLLYLLLNLLNLFELLLYLLNLIELLLYLLYLFKLLLNLLNLIELLLYLVELLLHAGAVCEICALEEPFIITLSFVKTLSCGKLFKQAETAEFGRHILVGRRCSDSLLWRRRRRIVIFLCLSASYELRLLFDFLGFLFLYTKLLAILLERILLVFGKKFIGKSLLFFLV